MKKLVSIRVVNLIMPPSFILLLALMLSVTACFDRGSQTIKPQGATQAPAQTQRATPPPPQDIPQTSRNPLDRPLIPQNTGNISQTSPAAAAILVSQDIVPSDKEQTVSWKDQVKVTVPAGLVDSRQKLTISPAPNLQPHPFKGLSQLAAFDISLGNLHELKKELTIEIAYDPAKVASDLPPEKAIRAAYWNPDWKTWVTSPARVDTRKNMVIVRTDHLSKLQIMYINQGKGVDETDHFTIVYEKNVWPILLPFNQPQVAQEPVKFAKEVGGYLEHAWSQYLSKGYLPRPNDQGWKDYEEYIRLGPAAWIDKRGQPPVEPPRILVFLDQNTEEAETKTLSGDIYLKLKYLSMNEVRHDAAHELFHNFQREASVANYIAKRWWMEATADYAADRIAWGGLETMEIVKEDYFSLPLDHSNDKGMVHAYSTSRFIDYLVKKGVDFKRLWDDSVGPASALDVLEAFVERTTRTPLRDHYRGFAEYILFDASSPLESQSGSLRGPIGRSGRIGGGVAEMNAPATLAADKSEMSYRLVMAGGYTAKLWGFTVANKDPKSPRTLKVEIFGIDEYDKGVDVYVLNNDQRPKGGVAANPSIYKGTINSGKRSMNLSVANEKEVIYILAFNTRQMMGDITVKVSDAGLTIVPPTASVNAGQNVSFTTPGITEKVLWSVQEGAIGGTISAAGVYTAPDKSGTFHVVATLDSDRTRTATAAVTVTAPNPNSNPNTKPGSAGGAWVLRDTRTRLEKIEDDQWDRHQVSGTGGSVSTRLDWVSRTDARRGAVTSTHAISPAAPPSRLVPGTNIEFKLERTLNTGGEPNKGALTAIYLYWEPGGGPDSSGSIWTPAAETGSPNWARVWNWKVPGKRVNAKMHVLYTASGPGGASETRYIYEWVD